MKDALKKSIYLPFQNIAIVCSSFDKEKKFVFFLERHQNGKIRASGVFVGGSLLSSDFDDLGDSVEIRPFVYFSDDSGAIKTVVKDWLNFSKKDILVFMEWIAICLCTITKNSNAYIPAASKSSSANARRIAKGKKPLYEWRTVTIDSPSLKSPHLGGSHASPRHHQRRGHWRSLRSGKKVWIRNASVGNAALGTVFHDYQVNNLDREAKA